MMNRRDFLKRATRAIQGAIALQMLAEAPAGAQPSGLHNDIDVLNYVLTLAYFQYLFYATGNGENLSFGGELKYLETIQFDEEKHVTIVSAAIHDLGGTPIDAPVVDYGGAFADHRTYLRSAFLFENLGVSALLGALRFISDRNLLQTVAGIYGIECRHAAVVADLLHMGTKGAIFMGAVEKPKSAAQVIDAIQPYIQNQALPGFS
jgi:Ferritin-like domain